MGAIVLLVLVTLVNISQSAPIADQIQERDLQSVALPADTVQEADKLVAKQSEDETDAEVLEREKRGYIIDQEAVVKYFITDAPPRPGFVPNKEFRTKHLNMRIIVTDDMESRRAEEPKANNIPQLPVLPWLSRLPSLKNGDIEHHMSAIETNSYPRLKRHKKMGRRMRRHRKQRRH